MMLGLPQHAQIGGMPSCLADNAIRTLNPAHNLSRSPRAFSGGGPDRLSGVVWPPFERIADGVTSRSAGGMGSSKNPAQVSRRCWLCAARGGRGLARVAYLGRDHDASRLATAR